MGRVYEAEQEHPRRRIALKTLHPWLLDERDLARFRDEAQALGALLHPGIPQIYQAGVEGQTAWLSMELIEGASLEAWSRGRSLHERVAMLVAICEAVHHANLRGLVHRDLKPDNLLVTTAGHPKVTDFGIAKSLHSEQDVARHAGTPTYMSPEQAGVELTPVDVRTDVYALGVVAWELLTGRAPLDLRDGTFYSAIAALAVRPPFFPAPEGLPADLGAILVRATAYHVDARYPSVQDLGDDLRRFLEGLPVLAHPQTRRYLAERFLRRHWVPVTALSVLVGVLAWGLLTQTLLASRLDRARDEIEEARAHLQTRNDELLLLQARAALRTDPSQAAALLAALSPDADWARAGAILEAARTEGIARHVLRGHKGEIRAVAFSPDGLLLASGGYDHVVRLWDLKSRSVRTLAGHQGRVSWVGFSPAGDRLASGAADGGTWLWRVHGRPRELASGGGPITAGAWSPDGARVAVGTAAGEVLVFDDVGALRLSGSAHRADVTAVAWSVAGDRVVSASLDGTLALWERARGPVAVLEGHPDSIVDVVVAPDDSYIASVDRSGHLLRWSWDGELLASAPLGGAEPVGITVSGGGEWLAVGDRAGDVTVVTPGGARVAERPLHEGVVREVAFRPHGRHLASVGDDGIVDLWELPAALHREYRGHGTAVRSLAFTDNGRRFATGGEGGSVRVWEPPSDAPTRFTPDEGRLLALAWSPDGSGVLTGSVDGSAWWVDPLVGPSAHFVGHTDEVGAVFVGLYGSRVTGGRDGTLRVWDELGTEVESADTGSIVGAVAMSPDGRFVVAATEVPSIAVWDRQAGTLSHRLGHIGRIYQVQVAQDGTVVSASADGTVRGWDPATGDSALLGRFDREATTLSVFEDAFVIAGGDDGTVRWLAAGEQKTVITHDGPVGGVALSQDGRFVASVGPDTARAVDLSTGEVYDWGRGPASAVDFSGTLVFLAADDGFVYAWDPPSGTVRVVGWASVGLRQLAISPDGERVAAIGHGPHVWIWPSRPEMGEGAVRARLASLTDVVLGVEEAVVSPFTEGR